MKKLLLLLLFLSLATAQESIRFGVFAYKGVELTRKQYAPLVDALNEKLDNRVVLEVLTQKEINEKIAQGKLDIVTTNPTHFLHIRHNYHLSGAVATLQSYTEGVATNKLAGVILVRHQSDLKRIEDLRGKKIATPSVTHMGACRAQAYEAYLHGVDIFKESTLLTTYGSQLKSVEAVLEGEADVAFVRDGIYEMMLQSGALGAGVLRVLNQQTSTHPYVVSTRFYPEWPVLILPHVSGLESKKFVAALLSLEPTKKLKEGGIYGYSLPLDYLEVEELSRTLRLPPFDKTPHITLGDIVERYRWQLLLVMALFGFGILFFARERKRKNFIHSLLSNIGDGVYGTDREGRCIWINQKALDLLGYREEEVLGKDQHLLFHHHKHNDGTYPVEECPIYKTQQDGKAREEKEWFIRKDGSFFPVDLTVASTQNGGVIVVFHDTSVFVRQAEEIVHQKERLHAIIEGTGVGTWEWNVQTSEVFLNDKWAQMLGYTLEELAPISLETWMHLTHPEDLQKAQKKLKEHFESKSEFYECELRMRHKDGQWIWVLDKGMVSRWSKERQPLIVSGAHLNISQRKAAQEELERQGELLELFFRQSMYGFFFMMLDEPIEWNERTDKERALDYIFEHQRITKINKAMLDQYGAKDESEFLGFTPADFFAHDIADGRRVWREFFDRGIWHINTNERKFDGSPMVVVGDYICLYDKEGRITGHFGVQREVTEEIRAKEALEAAKEEAERANSSKSAFLANMSHEIRTPMNAILGFSEILLHSDVDARQKNYLQKIMSSSGLLLEIINDILDFSKIEASKIELENKVFALDAVLNKLQMLFKQKALEKGVKLSFELSGDLPSLLMGDELRITQVLVNLMSNAIKFTKEGSIVLRMDVSDKEPSRAKLHIRISDSGIGMSEAQLQKLFKPFSQADSSTTREYGGTGLGLSISQGLVRAMGSQLEVESTLGVGSTFFFSLDVGVESWEGLSLVQEESYGLQDYPDLSHVRLLLVEDNLVNQEVITEILKRIHIRAQIANNGKEAVDLFLASPESFDIILMDIQMPLMSGYEATKIIREHNKEIPIIALTAAAMIEDREKVLEAGMNEHLSKPIQSDVMLRAIIRYFDAAFELPSMSPSQTQEAQTFLDVAYAMRLIGVNEALYAKILSKFSEELREGFAPLKAVTTLAKSDAKALLHALKGVSGNVGANRLGASASRLDAALKEGRIITQEEALELESHITQTLQEIERYLATHKPEQNEEQTRDLKTFFATLLKNIQEGTMVELEEQQLLYEMLRKSVNRHELEEWMRAMDNYDYDAAAAIMREWKV